MPHSSTLEKKAGEIKIEVKDVTGSLYLHQEFGSGTLGKTKFEACHTLPGMALVITINKKDYLVSAQDIIRAVVELVEKKSK